MSNVRFNCSVGFLRCLLATFLLASSFSAFALGTKGYVWYALGGPVPNGQDGPSYCQSLSNGTSVYVFTGERYNAKNDIVYGICSSGGGGFEMERSSACIAGYSLFNGDQCRKVCPPPSFNFPNDSDSCEVSPEPCKVTENYVAAVNQCRPKTCATGEYLNALGVCVANPPDTSTSSTTGDTTTSSTSGTTTSSTTGDTSTTGSTTSGSSTTTGDTTTTSTTSGSTTSGSTSSGGSTTTTSGSTGDTTSTSGTTGDTTTSGSTTTTTSTTSGSTGDTTTSGTTSGEGDEKGDDFCAKNPTLNICKNSNVSGACAQTTCEGDAITCAILRTQQKRDCEDHDEQNPQYKLGRSLLDGNDPEKSSLPSVKNAQEIDISKDISSQSWGGSGACFADKSITVMGKQIVIPISKVCPYLEALRYCIMLIASIISFRMVSGAVLRV